MTEMKPCPFCEDGGKPEVQIDVMFGVINRDEYVPRCTECGTEFTGEKGYFDNEEDAVEAWNSRRSCHRVLMDCYGNAPYNQTGLQLNDTCNGCSVCGNPWYTHGLDHPKFCDNCGCEVVND